MQNTFSSFIKRKIYLVVVLVVVIPAQLFSQRTKLSGYKAVNMLQERDTIDVKGSAPFKSFSTMTNRNATSEELDVSVRFSVYTTDYPIEFMEVIVNFISGGSKIYYFGENENFSKKSHGKMGCWFMTTAIPGEIQNVVLKYKSNPNYSKKTIKVWVDGEYGLWTGMEQYSRF